MAWATIEQVSEVTGVPVTEITEEDINRAQAVIDVKAGRTFDMQEMLENYERRRDLHFLKLAVAYQTVWMMAQPDYFTRSSVKSIGQDGVHVDFQPWAIELAPMAKAALRRLSWKGSRSVKVAKGDHIRRRIPPAGSPIYDTEDDVWEAL